MSLTSFKQGDLAVTLWAIYFGYTRIESCMELFGIPAERMLKSAPFRLYS
jgi:hypothetical protein